jgi:hypothetical protein
LKEGRKDRSEGRKDGSEGRKRKEEVKDVKLNEGRN